MSESTVSKNKLQEINDLLMLIKKEKLKFLKNDIFIDTILEINCGINEILRVKIKDIILRGELSNVLQAESDILSKKNFLDNFNSIELNCEEQNDLKNALELKISDKGTMFLQELNELSDDSAASLEEIVERIKFSATIEQNELVSLQKQLNQQQKLFISSLNDYGKKLQELLDIKTETAPKLSESKVNEMSVQSEKLLLRYKLLNQQGRLMIFEEYPMSIDTYRKALNDLKEQQRECSKEIEQLKVDIDKYKIIEKNGEFLEILKEFKQYKQYIEDKLWVRNKLTK